MGSKKEKRQRWRTLHVGQPLGLLVMLGGDGQGVEENQEDNQPVEDLRLDSRPALPPEQPVPPAGVPAGRRAGGREGGRDGRRRELSRLPPVAVLVTLSFVVTIRGCRRAEVSRPASKCLRTSVWEKNITDYYNTGI